MTLLTPLFIHLFCGAIAAVIGGLVFKKISIGIIGNILAGLAGGLLIGQGVSIMSHFDLHNIMTYITQAAKGAAGGGTLMILLGLIRYRLGTDRTAHRPNQ